MSENVKVLIGIPNGSGVFPASTVRGLLELRKPVPCMISIVEKQMIEMARNGLVQQALASGVSHLLMVDDDNPIPPETLEILLTDDKDIVITPILSRNPNAQGVHDLCAFYQRTINIDEKPIKLYEHIENFKDPSPLHRIDGGGTGCVLIKIDVLKKLFAKYKERVFERTYIKFPETEIDGKTYDSRSMSEDIQFCERAIEEGFEVWLDDRVRPLHLTAPKFVKYI